MVKDMLYVLIVMVMGMRFVIIVMAEEEISV